MIPKTIIHLLSAPPYIYDGYPKRKILPKLMSQEIVKDAETGLLFIRSGLGRSPSRWNCSPGDS